MTTAIVHRTPGLIDIRAFTTMGLSAKPRSDNPIGMFGTGLKLAIAALVRMGAEPVVWIGDHKYTFQSRAAEFRGQEYQQIRMKRERRSDVNPLKWLARYTDLPFTTEYAKFWQPWMVFREIEANTRDEGGETLSAAIVETDGRPALRYHHDGGLVESSPDHTTIIIAHPDYVAAWEKMDEVFLPSALRVPGEGGEATPSVQIFDDRAGRTCVYRRGLRALDTGKPTLRTYNFMADLELTEDRTIKYQHVARSHLANMVARSDDEDLIRDIVTAKDTHWEHNLEFSDWITPSETFIRVVRREKGVSVGAASYGYRHAPVENRERAMVDEWANHPRPWHRVGDSIVDAKNQEVMSKPYGFKGRWDLVAEALCARITGSAPELTPARREAYQDAFGVALGTESASMAGIPSAHDFWQKVVVPDEDELRAEYLPDEPEPSLDLGGEQKKRIQEALVLLDTDDVIPF